MSTRLDPLEYLERNDKWYLGGGRGAMFAPAFPRWLDRFGFWDETYFVDVRLERLFTVMVLGEDERPLPLRREGRRWTPDALTQTSTTPDGLRIREDKVLTPNDVLASRLTIHNEGKKTRTLQLIVWSLQDRNPLEPGMAGVSAEGAARSGDYWAWAHTVQYGETPYGDRPAENAGWGERASTRAQKAHELHIAVGADRPPVSACMSPAERADTSPLWELSVVPEKFRDGKLVGPGLRPRPDAAVDGTPALPSHIHLCLHYSIEVAPGQTQVIQFGASTNLDRNLGLLHLQNDLQQDVAALSRANWQEWFASVPYFECSDPYLQKYYWYRWYGIRLLMVDIGGHRIEGEEGIRFPYPCVFEGIGGFRSHISYSAQCHMLEAGWRSDPALAFGSMEGMFAAQEHSGYLPGHLYLWRSTRGFYHANWGANALQLYHITGDREFVERNYPNLARYGEYFERDRDREDSHLYDIVDQGETGQEYMSRYLFVDDSADDWRRIQLKGVDATVYLYQLQRALGEMAMLLGKAEEAAVWNRKADATREAVRTKMWDPERGFFFDVDPRTGERSPYAAAVGLYPFLCDIAGPEHLTAIRDHLLNADEFWTPHPVPASSKQDPFFSADAEWKGRRMSCPWNGRVWPMTNSHVAEALAKAADLDPELRAPAAEMIQKFVRMMFFDGDPERPNCFEHYNPETGTPSMYRGVDDYQHSWVVDLIVKYLAGIRPGPANTLTIDPLPFPVERFALKGVRYRGHSIDVEYDDNAGLNVKVNGEEKASNAELIRLDLSL
jgi:hypothetical protein